MLITDMNNIRVLRVYANASTGVVVASTGPWLQSRKVLSDSSRLNLFVIDSDYCLMTRYHNGSQTDTIVFGNTCGTGLTQFGGGASFCMDSAGNFYIADNSNHGNMFWKANATSGIVLVGTTGVSGSNISHLYYPEDVTLDEARGLLYVADTFNHRIGTVVADGNGPGVERK
jgi:hypothetical protein